MAQTLVLDTTTRTITAKMAGAKTTTEPSFVATWADDNGSTLVEGGTPGVLNDTSNVTLVAAPASSTRRVIKSISVQNQDTVSQTITVQYNDNGTYYNIAKFTLLTGEVWTTDGSYDVSGNLKTVSGSVNLATSVTGVLPAANGGTGIANSKTLTVSNNLTLAGTDGTTMTFPSTSATIARTDAANTFTGVQTLSSSPVLSTGTVTVSGNAVTIPGNTDTVALLGTAQTFTATQTQKALNYTNNAITASGNAATVPITYKLNTVTNNSAATLTITMTTTSAVDGQMNIVRILDASAVAQTITWVNTEDSTVTAPTTSNGSTTLFLTVGFIYNGGTSKWRCIAKA